MSFRKLIGRKVETHSRKHRRARQAEFLPAQVENLESRSLLSAIVPGLNQHGFVFTNANVGGQQTVVLNGSINPALSNNANGAGLFVDINGQTSMRELTLTGLQARNNGNAGIIVNLSNLQLDRLVIEASVLRENGGSGLVLQLNNAQIGQVLIRNSNFNVNQFDGLCVVASNNSQVNLLQAVRNTAVQNVNGDGIVFLMNGSSVTNFGASLNSTRGNGLNGTQIKLTNTPVENLVLRDNVSDGNLNGHGLFLDFIGSAVNTQIFRNRLINQQGGDGLRIRTQFSAAGLRNINLTQFHSNTFDSNFGNGFFADLARDTTIRGQVRTNIFTNNGGVGFGVSAADTENAIDLTIGGLTRVNNQLVHANGFNLNTGAAISLTLADPSGLLGDTTGRARILGNTIVGTRAGNGLTGEGIVIRAIGSTTLTNGAARWSQVRIDGNTIGRERVVLDPNGQPVTLNEGNAGHGIMFDISEDSQAVDVIIGNNTGTKLRFDVDGDFSIPGQQIIREPNDGNVISHNGGNGVHFLRRDSAVVRDVRILDNVIRQNQNGIVLVARNTYQAVPTAAVQGNLVSQFVINNNQVRNNTNNGIHVRTEADAVLKADIRYNFIDANGLNGIRASGLENNDTDFENIGGTWIKNRISNNGQNGIAIETVVGNVNPLQIGLDGFDAEFEPFQLGNQSLGNFIFANGEDGIDIAAQLGLPGTVLPQDTFRNSVSIINNAILENGRNTLAGGTPNPYTAGKGVDIEIFWGRQGGSGDLREVRLDRNIIQGNFGDGLEIRNRGGFLRLIALGNVIDLNGGRGVDMLNQTGGGNFSPEGHILFGDTGSTATAGGIFSNGNVVRSNGLEGFYVVNTASVNQTQDVDSRTNLLADAEFPGRFNIRPNLMIDMENNVIRDNGRGIEATGSPASTLSGTGLVVRVGTTNGAASFSTTPDVSGNVDPFLDSASAGVGTNTSEVGNGRVNFRVVSNDFSGNAGDDVFMESFTSTVDPPTTPGSWTDKEFKDLEPTYTRDPLARFNLVFRGNTGDSLDVVRGFFDANGDTNNAGAMYNNPEDVFKSRTNKQAPNPSGPFGTRANRARNAQRVADRPVQTPFGATFFFTGGGGLAEAFDGISFGGYSGASGFFGIPFSPANPAMVFGGQISTATDNPADPDDPIIVTVAGRTGRVADATNANPSVLTVFGHNFSTGDTITITGATGNTAINGTWFVDVNNANEFTLRDPVTLVEVAGNGAYNANSATWTVSGQHGLFTGDLVSISGVTGNPNANGTHVITRISDSQFALFVPDDPGQFDFFGNFIPGTGTPVVGNGSTGTGGVFVAHYSSKFWYDGIGPSTFRIESNWDDSGFTQNQFGDSFDSTQTYDPGIFDGVGFIQYDEVLPGTFSYVTAAIGDVTVDELAGTATFTVTLSEAAKENVFISYETSDGTAVAGSDYVPTSDFLFFTPGETSKTFTVNISQDSAFDIGEQFYVDLTSITGGSLLDSRGIATVQPDADQRPTVSITDTTVFPEGDAAEFTVTLSHPSSETVFVDFFTVDGTAVDGQDYLERIGTLIFNPNETTQTIRVDTLLDQIVEGAETFQVRLSNAQTTSTAGSRIDLTIADDTGVAAILDTAFVQVPSDVFVSGFGTGTTTADIEVTLSKPVPAGQSITVNFQTGGGSAFAGSDYVAQTGSITFNAGEQSKTVSITVNRDMIPEGDEFFFVNFTNGDNAAFAGNQQTRVTIREPGDVAGALGGGAPAVRMFGPNGEVNLTIFAYTPAFLGGVTVATGDMNGDGFPDIITGPGAGAGPLVRIFDGLSGAKLDEFQAFGTNFRGGVRVATGDVDGDGQLEIIVGAGFGGGSAVRVFDATGAQLGQFFAFDPGFTNGVNVASGDVDGDGDDEVIVGVGAEGPPTIRVFDGQTLTQVGSDIVAFNPGFTGGVVVSAGDVDGIAGAEIVVGVASNGGPAVAVFDGTTGAQIGSTFFAYFTQFFGGVRVATADINGDGRQEIMTGTGPGGGPLVRYFDGITHAQLGQFFAFGQAFRGGISVAGRSIGAVGEGSPLHFDNSVPPAAGAPADSVTQSDVSDTVSAALTRLAAAGLDAELLQLLASVEFVVTDLGGALLGLARPGVVLIDDDAAGHGWFVDYSPLVDEEFGQDGSAVDSRAAGRVDLLTAVLHEMGHELGLDHSTMSETLGTGVRQGLDSVFAGEDLFDALLTA